MRLLRRIITDISGVDQKETEREHKINEELVNLQTDSNGKRNKFIEILNVNEITKNTGRIVVFDIVYEDKSLD